MLCIQLAHQPLVQDLARSTSLQSGGRELTTPSLLQPYF